jgi:ABC-2 type transport system permease protein
MRTVLAIAGVELRRLLRDRSNLFFVFVFPFVLVLLIGAQFGGAVDPHLAVSVADDAGPLADDLLARIEDGEVFVLDRVESDQEVADRIARGGATVGVTIPAGYDTDLRSGAAPEIGVVSRQDGSGQELATAVRAAIAEQAGLVKAARVVAASGGLDPDEALDRVTASADQVVGLEVETTRVGESVFDEFDNLGQFDLGASSQLLLFVFLTSLTTGAASLIQTRQWGLTTRMLSTPTTVGQVLAGQALGRFGIAVVQAVYIVAGTVLLFDVNWGDPVGAAAVIGAFCLVSAAAGMLVGAFASNAAQAGGLGVFLSLGLAALGGSMAPLEVFSETMRRVGHLVTPHAWANDAFAELVRRGGGLADVATEVAILTAIGVVLLVVASWRLYRVTVRG